MISPNTQFRCLAPWPSSDALLRLGSWPVTKAHTLSRSFTKPLEEAARPNPRFSVAAAAGVSLTGVPVLWRAESDPTFSFWPASKVPRAAAAASTDQVTRFSTTNLQVPVSSARRSAPAPPLFRRREESSYRRREICALKQITSGLPPFQTAGEKFSIGVI